MSWLAPSGPVKLARLHLAEEINQQAALADCQAAVLIIPINKRAGLHSHSHHLIWALPSLAGQIDGQTDSCRPWSCPKIPPSPGLTLARFTVASLLCYRASPAELS